MGKTPGPIAVDVNVLLPWVVGIETGPDHFEVVARFLDESRADDYSAILQVRGFKPMIMTPIAVYNAAHPKAQLSAPPILPPPCGPLEFDGGGAGEVLS